MKTEKETDVLQATRYPLTDNLRFCLKNTMECYPLLLLWCALAVLVNTAIPVIHTFLPKIVIEKITVGDTIGNTVLITLAMTAALAILTGGKQFLTQYLFHHKFKMNTFYVQKVAVKGMVTDYQNQENDRFRKLQTESFTTSNANYAALTIYDVGIGLCSNVLGFGLYFGILTQLNPLLLVFLILSTVVGFWMNNRIIRWIEAHQTEKIRCQQRTGYLTEVSGDFKSAKDIRLYNMTRWLGDIYQQNLKDLNSWYKRYTSKVFGAAVCDSGLSLLRDIAAYAYLLYLVFASRISAADFVSYFGVITGFSAWLGGIFKEVGNLKRVNMSLNYLRTFLDYPDTYKRESGIDASDLFGEPAPLELRNLSYRYEGAEHNTLSHINLTIKPKEHLAIVGLNGAGKTTLIKLLCGLTDPTEGSVIYKGTDVREYNRDSYYRLFSAVFQQYSVLPLTFAEIVAEEEAKQVDRAKVRKCLQTAGLWEKIAALPKDMDTEYGKTIQDEGVELSGGEMQKLLLARALYREAPVILLDEPTAALDPIAESRLYEIYDQVMKERTAVFISHRLASTRFCDRIILVDQGTIVEEGTHEELLRKQGKYWELYEMQAKYYRENPKEGGEA